jgi:CDP-glucose 4,6-dehydratase
MVTQSAFWQNKRVLVTGATGLVGSWLVKYLCDLGAQTVALVHHPDPQTELYRSGTHQNVNIVQGNLEDYALLLQAINKFEIDTVFHLAAQPLVNPAYREPLQTFETNIRGTYHILEACRQHPSLVQRVIIASSDKAYGTSDQLPYVEDMLLQGQFPYEVSKSCADLLAQAYFYSYNLPVGVTRCGNIYGGGDLNWSRLIPETIRACLQHRPVVIRSDGTFLRDYIYIKDVCNAYLTIAEQLDQDTVRGQAFNFSPERANTVLEVVDMIRTLTGAMDIEPQIVNTAQGEIHSQYLDCSKAQNILSWQPQHSLEMGLRETIEWYRAFLEKTLISAE